MYSGTYSENIQHFHCFTIIWFHAKSYRDTTVTWPINTTVINSHKVILTAMRVMVENWSKLDLKNYTMPWREAKGRSTIFKYYWGPIIKIFNHTPDIWFFISNLKIYVMCLLKSLLLGRWNILNANGTDCYFCIHVIMPHENKRFHDMILCKEHDTDRSKPRHSHICGPSIQIMNVYVCNGTNIFMRWKMKCTICLVEWYISSFTEWKYLFHCMNEKTFIICLILLV